MHHSSLFYSYIEACFKKIQSGLDDYFTSGSVEPLFKIRVSIKKLRVCISCLEYFNGKKDYRDMRSQFKTIFKSGGCLRELKLYNEWFNHNKLTSVATGIELGNLIMKSEIGFSKMKSKVQQVMKAAEKRLLKDARHISQEKLFIFYTNLVQEHLNLFFNKVEKSDWHKQRKKIKRILYARHWQEGRGLAIISRRQAIFLDRFQHEIGDWHDTVAMGCWIAEQMQIHNDKNLDLRQKMQWRKGLKIIESDSKRLSGKVAATQKSCSRVMKPICPRLAVAQRVLSEKK